MQHSSCQGRPQCQRCYQRPVGKCGRCGRVRTIVRLAVDGDPDLCALCWAALLHLAARLPAAIVADVVGVHIATATQWAQIAGRPWGDYPSLRGAATVSQRGIRQSSRIS